MPPRGAPAHPSHPFTDAYAPGEDTSQWATHNCVHAPGPLRGEEYDALDAADALAHRKERQEAEHALRRVGAHNPDAPGVLRWLPGMPAGQPARVHTLHEWDALTARHRRNTAAVTLPAPAASGLRVVPAQSTPRPSITYQTAPRGPHGWTYPDGNLRPHARYNPVDALPPHPYQPGNRHPSHGPREGAHTPSRPAPRGRYAGGR